MSIVQSLKCTARVFKAPHFTPYKVYIQRKQKNVVCLNPKVGSTAFREILVEGLQRQGIAPFRSKRWPMNTTRRYTTAPLADYLDAFTNPHRYTFHCFVRNPYSRVLSAWNDKLVKGFYAEQYPRSMRKLVPQIRRFADVNKLEGGDTQNPVPFSTFVSYIESQDEGFRNQHWDTQCSVLNTRHIHYKHIYPMETQFAYGIHQLLAPLNIDPQWLDQKLSRPSNASGKITTPILDQALADRLYALYKDDFEMFGYDRDSWHAL